VAENPEGRARLSRDDLRAMLHGRYISRVTEAAVTTAQHAAARALLAAGIDVVADDTNLKPAAMEAWEETAALAGVRLVVWDLTDVPLEVCLARDATRTGTARVGEQVIRDMHAEYIAEPQPLETS
jgi:predicted kinase